MMEVERGLFEQRVLETVKRCEVLKEPPLVWATEMARCVLSAGFQLPSAELGEALVSHLCFAHNEPSMWKFLDNALASRLVSPLHVLSLLCARVVPSRHDQPEAYRLCLELISRYAFSVMQVESVSCRDKIVESVDAALQLSENYRVRILDLGHAHVLFFFSIVIGLIDCTLDDWGLRMAAVERLVGAFGVLDSVSMDIDSNGSHRLIGNDRREQMRRTNPSKAMEVLCQLTGNRQAMVLLRLVKLNMAKTFRSLLQRIQFLEVHKARSNLQSTIEILSSNNRRVVDFKYHLKKRQLTGMLVDIETEKSLSCNNVVHGQSACWVSYDIYMESAMDGKQLPITSAIGILKETICTLQVFNRASWHETFLALWLSALRLVQRERDPPEGPIPHLECRLCVLLSIVPLTIAKVIKDEAEIDLSSLQNNSNSNLSSKQQGLVSSLQNIGQFTGLLCPPPSVVGAANNAAAKAANFVSGSKNVNMGMRGSGHNDTNLKAGGNLRHLIVEACIARNLLDSSAYLWPGYVPTPAISPGEASAAQRSPWLTFMEGAPLKGSLIGALISTPASSVTEIDKLYQVALNGNEEERPAAAKILCGASLSHGWNIQEHVVNCVVKLLSPPVPSKFSGVGSHLLEYTSMLSALLFGTSSIDTVHILSLHGVIPEVAAALLPLCEAFGSLVPTSTHHSSETSTIYMVFSSAFLFLLRLWKFYRPPFEQCVSGRGGAIGGDLTLEFLLLLRNSRISAHNSGSSDGIRSDSTSHVPVPDKLVYIDSYPKLRAWYCQNKSCIASTLSGLCSGNPVHQVANNIISMIYFRINKKGSSASNLSATSSGSLSESPASTGEDSYQRPLLPAWEVLEAMPFVLEALLTACAYGRLSSRDLTTGLRDLIDFLPATLAAIISYFSAEVTRGLWKPVLMNGTDWPSPAANFSSVESELKQILAAVDVNVPSFSGISSAMLPLPMAALVSLTITFKLDKSLEYIHAVAGPALENCASSCPWPSMSIVGSLWAQKVKRWHDFIVVSCTRSVIQQNKAAVAQLLRSCFTSFLGPLQVSDAPLGTQTGISGLLGNLISARGACPSIQPGFLYLRTCRLIQNVQYVNDVIVHLVSECSQKLGAKQVRKEAARLKSSRASLALATAKAKEIATLGASLLCITGGPSLVQELYQETIPTWLLSAREESGSEVSAVSRIIEGYTMAYLVVLSGSFVWGLGTKLPSWAFLRRAHILRAHLDLVAEVLEGNVSLGCHPTTWKAYVSCLVGLIVSLAPLWIKEVKVETLKKLSSGLRGWRECELALSLLERGGAAAMGTVAELMYVISA